MTGARRDPRVLRRRLAECVTVVAAAAALATAIDDTATRIVIAAVAVVLVGLVALLTEREALAGDAEELRLRLRDGVPIARLRDLDPHRLGVDPEVIGGWAYVDRAVDASLRTALRDALNVSGPSLIAVRGPSKAGKSRTLYEAARHEAADAWVVAPRDAEAFADLLKPDGLPRLEAGPAVVWLDDLEPFVRAGAHGLTPASLERLGGWDRPVLVLATAGGKGLLGLDPGARRGLEDPLSALLGAAAAEVVLNRELRAEEQSAAAAAGYDPGVVDEMKGGLGEYMIAARRLERRLDEAQDACPEGFAVAMAAIDWARAGMPGPVDESWLRRLWTHYLPPGLTGADDEFARGLKWARTPLYASIALLRGNGPFRPYDYAASYVQRVHRTPIEPAAWDAILAAATESDAFEAGIAAWGHNDPDRATRAFAAAAASTDPTLAGAAAFNLGVLIEVTDTEAFFEAQRLSTAYEHRREAALKAYRRADACGHAAGAYNLARLLDRDDSHQAEVEAAYRRADERGRAEGAVNLGAALEARGDLEGAEAAYRRAEERGDHLGTFNLANLLRAEGRLDEAQAAYLRAERQGAAFVTGALVTLLEQRGDRAGAAAAAARDRGVGDGSRLHEHRWVHGGTVGAEEAYRLADERGYATGARELGLMLWNRGDHAAAEAALRRALERGDTSAAGHLSNFLAQRKRWEEATEMARKGDDLGDGFAAYLVGHWVHSDNHAQAEAAFRRAEARGYWGASESLGEALRRRGDLEGAEDAFRRAIAQGQRHAGAALGALLEDRGALDEAETAFRESGSSLALGDFLRRHGDSAGAAAAYQEASRYSEVARERLAELEEEAR